MVADSGATLGPRALRRLKSPISLQVNPGPNGHPDWLRRAAWPTSRQVERTLDRWRIDDEWWREREVSRMYYSVLVAGGIRLTVFQDLMTGKWFEQED
jgi:hypothetical protein